MFGLSLGLLPGLIAERRLFVVADALSHGIAPSYPDHARPPRRLDAFRFAPGRELIRLAAFHLECLRPPTREAIALIAGNRKAPLPAPAACRLVTQVRLDFCTRASCRPAGRCKVLRRQTGDKTEHAHRTTQDTAS